MRTGPEDRFVQKQRNSKMALRQMTGRLLTNRLSGAIRIHRYNSAGHWQCAPGVMIAKSRHPVIVGVVVLEVDVCKRKCFNRFR